ncbi:MAG TPA: dihydropteroate synthase, partial [Planctomycetota bacterium]|nr:dihydropteroate synthase [Planctomycetota bacterium]
METELILRLNSRVLQANREWVSVALHRLDANEMPAFGRFLHPNGGRQILAGPRGEIEQACSTAGAAGAAVIQALEGFEKAAHILRFGARSIALGRETLLMGVLNTTPDSFYDGGAVRTADEAIQKGLRMVEQGAAVIDVGGESTR